MVRRCPGFGTGLGDLCSPVVRQPSAPPWPNATVSGRVLYFYSAVRRSLTVAKPYTCEVLCPFLRRPNFGFLPGGFRWASFHSSKPFFTHPSLLGAPSTGNVALARTTPAAGFFWSISSFRWQFVACPYGRSLAWGGPWESLRVARRNQTCGFRSAFTGVGLQRVGIAPFFCLVVDVW